MDLKRSFAKWWPFCPGGDELMETCKWLWQLIELMEFVVAYTVVEIA